MAKADEITVEVKVNIPNKTVARCMRIIEMWLDDNPSWTIVCDREGDRHKLHFHVPMEMHESSDLNLRQKTNIDLQHETEADYLITTFHGEDWYKCRRCGKMYEYYQAKNNDDYCPHCNGYGLYGAEDKEEQNG